MPPELILTFIPAAQVVSRQIFYNRSTSNVFGNGTGNPTNAIAVDKTVLLPGQTTSPDNYTNYARGLNGFLIDLTNATGSVGPSDFLFATWNGIAAGGFIPLSAVPVVTNLPTAGLNGSHRVKVEFDDGVIRNTWLRVMLKVNPNLGLKSDDVFYFGNAVGDMNVGNIIGSPTIIRTNAIDTAIVRQNQSPDIDSVGIDNIYDVNRDGRVNSIDTALLRQNQSPDGAIAFFTAPGGLALSRTAKQQSLATLAPVITSPFASSPFIHDFFFAASATGDDGTFQKKTTRAVLRQR
jgi:hypothetical protein